MSQWQQYSEKYLTMTLREQILVLITGLVVVVMGFYNLVIDGNLQQAEQLKKGNSQLVKANADLQLSIDEMRRRVADDPNKVLMTQIAAYQQKVKQIDSALLQLTSELIDPLEMRTALSELLAMQPGVTLVSFELIGANRIMLGSPEKRQLSEQQASKEQAEPVQVIDANEQTAENQSIGLYRHGIRLKLTGSYFQLRNYLRQLENLSWRFFWQEFDYQLSDYPKSELMIEIYSLSTEKEFIGV